MICDPFNVWQRVRNVNLSTVRNICRIPSTCHVSLQRQKNKPCKTHLAPKTSTARRRMQLRKRGLAALSPTTTPLLWPLGDLGNSLQPNPLVEPERCAANSSAAVLTEYTTVIFRFGRFAMLDAGTERKKTLRGNGAKRIQRLSKDQKSPCFPYRGGEQEELLVDKLFQDRQLHTGYKF